MSIYLDNAATSYPKPESVYAAVDHYQRQIGASVGRGAYRQAVEAQRIVDRCRQSAARLLGAEGPDRIVFTFNGTDGLNLALMGLCRPGDHVITTMFEHNSVLRPLNWLQEHRGIELTSIRPNPTGIVTADSVRSQIRPTTRLIAIQHASNVTGIVQPIEAICEVARQASVISLVDAAQSAGHLPIDVRQFPVDVLVCPGHKGLLGPLGTGLVYIRPGVEQGVAPYRMGGTGTNSEDVHQPESMPERFESGNHNAPALAGLDASLAWLHEQTIPKLRQHEADVTSQLVDQLRSIPAVTVYSHQPGIPHVGVVSFNITGFTPQEAAAILDESFQIQSRPGLHCAPGAHAFLGTLPTSGALRFSPGPFTTPQDIAQATAGVKELAG